MLSETQGYLKELCLSNIRSTLENSLNEAEKHPQSHLEFCHSVFRDEVNFRRGRKAERLLSASRLPLSKNMQNFDMMKLPLPLQRKIAALRSGLFLERKENILIFGKPGTGKTHLAIGIAHEQVLKGRKVYFSTTSNLVQELLKAKREFKLPALLRNFRRFEAVVLDDIGYVKQNREEMEVLFTFLADKYETGSIILTSNLPFSKWEEIFKDPMTTAATVDRLVHHCVILEMNTESYRLNAAKEARKSSKNNTEE